MAEFYLIFFTLPAILVSFGVLTNIYRDRRSLEMQLIPNCLLTRKPIVFVTGVRSLFYFRKYWNYYPSILAEHGYEVFTLHLPWRGPARVARMKEFFAQQGPLNRKFHFICDQATQRELNDLMQAHANTVASLTVLKHEEKAPSSNSESFTLNLAYKLHRLQFAEKDLPSAKDLGICAPTATKSLLQRMQSLGEQDFLT